MTKTHITRIAYVLLAALVGFFLNSRINNNQEKDSNRVRIFDQSTTIRHFDNRELEKDHWRFYFKDKPIHSYNDINVGVYNFEDKSYENVKVYITITPQEGDTLQLMTVKINGESELVQQIKCDSQEINNGALKLCFLITTANQTTDYNKPVFDINIRTISAKTPQQPKITIDHRGIASDPELLTPNSYHKHIDTFFDTNFGGFIEFIFIAAIVVFVFLAFLIKIGSLITRSSDERKVKDDIENLTNSVKEEFRKKSLDITNIDAIITEYERLAYRDNYDHTSPISRWLASMRKPD